MHLCGMCRLAKWYGMLGRLLQCNLVQTCTHLHTNWIAGITVYRTIHCCWSGHVAWISVDVHVLRWIALDRRIRCSTVHSMLNITSAKFDGTTAQRDEKHRLIPGWHAPQRKMLGISWILNVKSKNVFWHHKEAHALQTTPEPLSTNDENALW